MSQKSFQLLAIVPPTHEDTKDKVAHKDYLCQVTLLSVEASSCIRQALQGTRLTWNLRLPPCPSNP